VQGNIILTGAAGGIGGALCARLRSEGVGFLATDVQPGEVNGVEILPLDVRSSEGWQDIVDEAMRRWGRIDALINLAGVARAGHFHTLERAEVDRHIDVNFKGAALGAHAVLPVMRAQGTGHIINVGSLAALAPVPGIALYSASKHALRAWSLALAMELEDTGIAVTLVHPDLVDTPMIAEQRSQPEVALSFSGKRTLSADEVARCVVEEALVRRPLELALPRTRGALCKVVGALPRLSQMMKGPLTRRGLARQAEERASHAGEEEG
jgi:3-oxoacyl-[acyl-carrier protein] reductase